MISSTLRVGYAAGDWQRWLGGVNYYRNLLRAVADDPESDLDPILFLGQRSDRSALGGFPPLPIVRSRIFDRRSPAWALRGIGRRALHRDPAFERLLLEEGAQALSHSTQLWRSSQIAMLGWIADFQHLRLPQFFPPGERRRRDRVFAEICSRSTLVILSSESCRRDLTRFFPAAAGKARVLRFVAEPAAEDGLPSSSELDARYGIQRPYFHLPNQFWKHKNHALVVEALGILRQRGIHPQVVATGETRDFRDPRHFPSLIARAREIGVEDQLRVLGVVDHADAGALMRGALAVINPSRCEGWSTTVEESKSLGKPVLLSDIDTHREQDPAAGVFFDPEDAEGLADAIAALWGQGRHADERELRSAAAAALPRRRLDFARRYQAIVREAVAHAGS